MYGPISHVFTNVDKLDGIHIISNLEPFDLSGLNQV